MSERDRLSRTGCRAGPPASQAGPGRQGADFYGGAVRLGRRRRRGPRLPTSPAGLRGPRGGCRWRRYPDTVPPLAPVTG